MYILYNFFKLKNTYHCFPSEYTLLLLLLLTCESVEALGLMVTMLSNKFDRTWTDTKFTFHFLAV